jgi:hypothetical protein
VTISRLVSYLSTAKEMTTEVLLDALRQMHFPG